MNWRVKAAIQKTLDVMPFHFGEHLNRELPRALGRRNIAAEAERAIQISLSHYRDMLSSPETSAIEARKVLELGTGYNFYTALPLALLGHQVTTLDLARDVRFPAAMSLHRALQQSLSTLVAAAPAGQADAIRARSDRIAGASDFADFLNRAQIRYLAPYDAESFAAEFEGAFDYVYSHCVFEHIPPALFPPVLGMLRRVSRDGARYSHQVDMRDHRSSEGFLIDKNLSYLDYLRFSDRSWKFWNGNGIAYTNRWRKSDYLKALRENGFEVDGTNDSLWDKPSLPLPLEALDPQFRSYSQGELRVMSMFVYGHAGNAKRSKGAGS